MNRRVVTAITLALLWATVAVTPVAGNRGPSVDHSERPLAASHEHPRPKMSGSQADTVLNVSYSYRRLSDRPGVVEVTMRLPATPGIERVSVGFGGEMFSVVETTNVERNGSTYEWTGDADAKLVYRLRLKLDFRSNWRDSWTMAGHRPPSIQTAPDVDVNGTIVTDGGYVGGNIVLLGEYDVYRRQVDGETIEVVVPGNVSLLYGPRRTLGALANTSRALDVGGRDEVVHAFVTPRIRIPEATRFYSEAMAADDRILIDADAELAAWIHEYVHTRQEFAEPTTEKRQAAARAESIQWLVEGSARFYEWRLAAEFGYASWNPLRETFGNAADDRSVLSDRGTWNTQTDYTKGALVVAAIDREIRATTDGNHTIEDAIRRVNGDEPTVEDFIQAVREIGGPAAAETAKKFVTTAAVPDVQRQSTGLAAVYGNATRIETRTVGLSVSNATGTRQFDATNRQIRLGPNETLRLTVRIENTGSVRGLAAVAPQVTQIRPDPDGTDLERIDTTWIGWVGPGETIERTVTHQFDRPGTYRIETEGGRSYRVTVGSNRGATPESGQSTARTTTADDQATGTTTVEAETTSGGNANTDSAGEATTRVTGTMAVEAGTPSAGNASTASTGGATTQAAGDTAVFGVFGVVVVLTALVVAARVTDSA